MKIAAHGGGDRVCVCVCVCVCVDNTRGYEELDAIESEKKYTHTHTHTHTHTKERKKERERERAAAAAPQYRSELTVGTYIPARTNATEGFEMWRPPSPATVTDLTSHGPSMDVDVATNLQAGNQNEDAEV